MNFEDKLKIMAGDDALRQPKTDKQKLCKCVNYLLTQYWISVKDDEEERERYEGVKKLALEILE